MSLSSTPPVLSSSNKVLPLSSGFAAAEASPKKHSLFTANDVGLAVCNALDYSLYYSYPNSAYRSLMQNGEIANHVFRQILVAKMAGPNSLPLYLAVSPAGHLFSTILADELGAKSPNAAYALSLTVPLASAAVVGARALSQLKLCLTSLRERPLEALTAIPLHLFNAGYMVCSAGASFNEKVARDWLANHQPLLEQNSYHKFMNLPIHYKAEDLAIRDGLEKLTNLESSLAALANTSDMQELVSRSLGFEKNFAGAKAPYKATEAFQELSSKSAKVFGQYEKTLKEEMSRHITAFKKDAVDAAFKRYPAHSNLKFKDLHIHHNKLVEATTTLCDTMNNQLVNASTASRNQVDDWQGRALQFSANNAASETTKFCKDLADQITNAFEEERKKLGELYDATKATV